MRVDQDLLIICGEGFRDAIQTPAIHRKGAKAAKSFIDEACNLFFVFGLKEHALRLYGERISLYLYASSPQPVSNPQNLGGSHVHQAPLAGSG